MNNPGIAFIVKIRDEEATLFSSINSLKGLTIDYEIILILHKCTDQSAAIAKKLAEENSRIVVVTYNVDISLPGYATLATDASSPHSLITYYNWCLALARYPWTFKWDADFIASNLLIAFLNGRTWPNNPGAKYSIEAQSTFAFNRENYLTCGPQRYFKYFFWEYLKQETECPATILPSQVCILHASELSTLKSYWLDKPWYLQSDTAEAALVKSRIDKLVNDYGPEPMGMARASNPACNEAFYRIKNNNPAYVNVF